MVSTDGRFSLFMIGMVLFVFPIGFGIFTNILATVEFIGLIETVPESPTTTTGWTNIVVITQLIFIFGAIMTGYMFEKVWEAYSDAQI